MLEKNNKKHTYFSQRNQTHQLVRVKNLDLQKGALVFTP